MDSPITSQELPHCGSGVGRGSANVTLLAILLAASIPAVLLRIYVRTRVVQALWWDDAALLLALLLFLPSAGIGFFITSEGLGRHISCIGIRHVSVILRYGIVIEVLNSYSVTFSRVSIALMVNRLFGVSRSIKFGLYAYTTFMFGGMIITSSMFPAVCEPRKKFWNPMMPGDCWPTKNVLAISYLNGAISVLSDCILAALPVMFMWKLQMPIKRKVGLGILMGLGIFTCACAIGRTVFTPTLESKDLTYKAVMHLIFSHLESGTSVIAAAIPAIWPLFSRRKESRASSGHRRLRSPGQETNRMQCSNEKGLDLDAKPLSQPKDAVGVEGLLRGDALPTHSATAWADRRTGLSDSCLPAPAEVGIR